LVVTLRNLPPGVEARLREKARISRASLSQTVIGLLEESLGLRAATTAEHHDLDWLAGTWSKREADAFDRTLSEQRTTEKALWR